MKRPSLKPLSPEESKRRRPLPPEQLGGSLHDTAHKTTGRSRAAKAHRALRPQVIAHAEKTSVLEASQKYNLPYELVLDWRVRANIGKKCTPGVPKKHNPEERRSFAEMAVAEGLRKAMAASGMSKTTIYRYMREFGLKRGCFKNESVKRRIAELAKEAGATQAAKKYGVSIWTVYRAVRKHQHS